MSEPGVVVVLDGPALVGRSTTLAGLQAAWPKARPGPLLEVGLDTMLRSFGPGARRWQKLVLASTPPPTPRTPGPRPTTARDPDPYARGDREADPDAWDDQLGTTLGPGAIDIDLGPDTAEPDPPWAPKPTTAGPGFHPGGVWWGPLGRELVAAMHRAAAAWARAGVDVAIDHLLLDRATAQDLQTALDGLRVVHVGLVCDTDVLEDREADAGVPLGTSAAQQRVSHELIERDLVLDTSQSDTGELVDAILVEVRRKLCATS